MRWRDVKNKKYKQEKPQKQVLISSPILWRMKAFITDSFMIYIPILYITTYLILDGKEDFLSNQIAVFVDTFLFGFILSIFFAKSGQSPGFRAYEMKLIDKKTMEKPSFFKVFFRYFCFLISGASVVGLFLCFFRKDKQNLHDIMSQTMAQNV